MSWEDVEAGWGRHAAAFAYLIENLHWREYQHLLDQTGVASGTRYLDSIGIPILRLPSRPRDTRARWGEEDTCCRPMMGWM